MGNNNKYTIHVEANVMHMYAKFQLHPPYGLIYVAMATNQFQRFGQNSYES